MKNVIINVALFTAGATVGSVVTWKLVSSKCEKRTQQEIDSVKESFAKRKPVTSVVDISNENVVVDIKEARETREDNIARKKKVEEIIKDQGYTDYSNCSKQELDESDDENEELEIDAEEEPSIYAERDSDIDEPYVIAPWEFGEAGGDYEKISLTYYADGILADELDALVESVDSVVGLDSLDRFGEYEDDSVFVRNDTLKCDYEILKDQRRWEDIVSPPKPKTRKTTSKKPHQMEE